MPSKNSYCRNFVYNTIGIDTIKLWYKLYNNSAVKVSEIIYCRYNELISPQTIRTYLRNEGVPVSKNHGGDRYYDRRKPTP